VVLVASLHQDSVGPEEEGNIAPFALSSQFGVAETIMAEIAPCLTVTELMTTRPLTF